MQAAAKISITIPADPRDELEAQLDAAAQAAIGQDSRFSADGGLLIFAGEIDPALEDELDHRRDREERLDELGRGVP